MMKYATSLNLKCDHPSGYRLHFSGRIGDTFYGVGKAPTQGKNLTQAKLVEFAREKGWKFHRNDTQSCPSCVKEKRGIPQHLALPPNPNPTPPPLPRPDWINAPDGAECYRPSLERFYKRSGEEAYHYRNGVWKMSGYSFSDIVNNPAFVKRPQTTTTESRAPGFDEGMDGPGTVT